MKIIKDYNRKGFFASLCDALRHIRVAELEGEVCRVEWDYNSLYYDHNIGSNVWEYFFEQLPQNVSDLKSREVFGYLDIPETGNDFRVEFNRLINKYIKFNSKTQEKYNNIKQQIPKDTIGVHVRLTDKFTGQQVYGEPENSTPLPIEEYVKATKTSLEKYKCNSVFLATDDSTVVEEFSRHFKRLIYLNGPRSTGVESIHTGMKDVSGYLKGYSVLMDSYILSNCKFLVRSTSNVSSFSQFINLDLEHVNLNEIILGDKREEDYGLKSTTL